MMMTDGQTFDFIFFSAPKCIDLNDSYITLKFSVIKKTAGGADIKPVEEDYLIPINLTLYSLFRDLNFKINGHQVKKRG